MAVKEKRTQRKKPKDNPFDKSQTPIDWKVDDFVFIFPKAKSYKLKLDILNALTGAQIERTIEGASTLTLTLSDPNQALLLSGIMDTNRDGKPENVEVQVHDNWYRLVSWALDGAGAGTVTMTFEDRDIAHLRTFKKYREWKRTKRFTRSMAVKAMCDEAGIRSYIPELKTRQPIGN